MKILRHSNDTEKKELFCLIGEYFASAQVRKELGGPMTSDNQYTWFIALNGDTVQGFAAVKVAGEVCELKHCYILPEYRQQGLSTELLTTRLDYLKSLNLRKIVAVIVASRLKTFEKLGFENMGNRGQYIRMRKLL